MHKKYSLHVFRVLSLSLMILAMMLFAGQVSADNDYVDPTQDGSTGSWSANPSGNYYVTIDEQTRQPNTPTTSDYISGSVNNAGSIYLRMGNNITNASSVSDVTVWIYHNDGSGGNGYIDVALYDDNESTLRAADQRLTRSASNAWHSITFSSLSLTQAQLNTLSVRLTGVKSGGGAADTVTVYAMYADVTYTPVAVPPTQIVFTNSERTLSAGVCNGAANVLTLQLQDSGGTARNPTGSTVIRISSTSPSETFYTDSSCTSEATNGDYTFTTSENTKSVYVIDTRRSSPTWTLTASKQSGPDTITNGTQSYTLNAGSVVDLLIALPGQSFSEGTGVSGTPDLNGGAAGINAIAGTSFDLVSITAVDSYNNINTGYTGSKNFTWQTGAGYPTAAPAGNNPSYPASANFSNGQATSGLTITLYDATLDAVQTTEALAVDDSDDAGNYYQDSTSFSVEAGSLNDFNVSVTTPQIAGVCFTGTNIITARDAYQNKRTQDASTVNMTSSGSSVNYFSSGGCSGSTTQFVLSSGEATVYVSSSVKQSGITITATKDGSVETGTSGSISVDPAEAYAILVILPNQSFVDGTGVSGSPSFTGLRTPDATAGTSFTADLKAVDQFNNLVDSGSNNYSGSKTISFADSVAGNAPNGQTPSFPSSVTFTNGEANNLTFTYYNAESGRTIEADDTVTSVSGTASTAFTVQAATVNNYGIEPAASSQIAGEAFNVSVSAQDQWDNTLGSFYNPPSGTYTWTTSAENAPDSTPPSIGTLTQGDFSNGVATKSVSLYSAESGVTFTASEPSPSTVTGTSSTTVTVGPGDISADAGDSSVSGNPTGVTNINVAITITLKDTWRNPISGVAAGNISLSSSGDATVTQPVSSTNGNGQTTGQVQWSGDGNKTVTVAISTVPLVQDDGSTADADGNLDDTHTVEISIPPAQTVINGGTLLRGGSQLGSD